MLATVDHTGKNTLERQEDWKRWRFREFCRNLLHSLKITFILCLLYGGKNVKCVTTVDTMKRVHTSIPILPECWPLWITLARTLLRGKRMGRDGDSARSTEICFTV